MFVLVVIGAGLIFVIYGAPAGLLGLACLVTGAGVIGVLWLAFTVIEKWAQ